MDESIRPSKVLGYFAEVHVKKPLKYCVNGDGRKVQSPSWVLCKECLAKLDAKFKALANS